MPNPKVYRPMLLALGLALSSCQMHAARDIARTCASALTLDNQHAKHAVIAVRHQGAIASASINGWSSAQTFPIGSLTKQITGIAVLHLLARSRFTTSADLREFVPGLDPATSRLTVTQLLQQTTGLPDYVPLVARGSIRSSAELRRWLKRIKPEDTFGSFAYSNTNYYLLGIVIEKISRMPYNEYVKDRLLAPIGLRAAQEHLTRHVPAGVADDDIAYSAGDLRMSPSDLLRWTQAIAASKFGGATLPELKQGFQNDYYYAGFVRTYVNGREVFFHEGAVAGIESFLAFYPDQRDDAVVAVTDDPSANLAQVGVACIKSAGSNV